MRGTTRSYRTPLFVRSGACEVEHPPPRAEAVAEPGAPEVWSVEPAEEVGALLFELT